MADNPRDTKWLTLWIVLLLLVLAARAQAVQIEDIIRLKGAESNTLIGMGLVVGLNGTGDGGEFLPAMRPLAQVIQRLVPDPNVIVPELADAQNVALVALRADIPPEGVREGERVDVYVSSVGPAESLAGGELLVIPMTGPLPNSPVYAFAAGPMSIEDDENPTVGRVTRGAQMVRDIRAQYFDEYGRLTLIIDEAHASWAVANTIASQINGLMAPPDGPPIAKAVDEKNIIVEVPMFERDDPAAYISEIMQTYLHPSQVSTGGRVVINEKTGAVVITGQVQISPVIITHEDLTITTLSPPPIVPEPQEVNDHFIALDPGNEGGAALADLLSAFNRLKVDSKARIEIIKMLHASRSLHAELIFE